MDEEPESLESGLHETGLHEAGLHEAGLHEAGLQDERRPARKWIALALLAGLAGLTWITIDPGKFRSVVLVLLAGFALRILLTRKSSF